MAAMASTPFSFDYISSKQLQFSILIPKIQDWHSCRAKSVVRVYCSSPQTIHSNREKQINEIKKQRKPRPSFVKQVQDKWSVKPTSLREKFPWQEGNSVSVEEVVEAQVQISKLENPVVNDSVSSGSRVKVNLAPWVHGKQPKISQLGESSSLDKSLENCEDIGSSREQKSLNKQVNFDGTDFEKDIKLESKVEAHVDKGITYANESVRLPWEGDKLRKSNAELAEKLMPEAQLKRLRNAALRMVERIKVGSGGVTQELVDSIQNKWKVDEIVKLRFEGAPSHNMKRTHDILEHRTGGLVIWRSGSSIVLYRGISYKLPCVQSFTSKIHDVNESEYPNDDSCQSLGVKCLNEAVERPRNGSTDLSGEEIVDLSELNMILDEVGPRFKDWSGRGPMPVDADLLPAVVPGYRPPFRRLPYGAKLNLKNKEMTYLRRTARIIPPHFALGRNRQLQGLAAAMVKLWRRSAIAKIAIKRGVLNTSNERMAEELKVLTGGTLLSRNKDYIVFYRGNDFLSPRVTEALEEAERKSDFLQDQEEQVRQRAATSIDSDTRAPKRPLVAGTLSETMAATSRWGNQPSIEEREKMLRDAAVARHASLVKYLDEKLALAKGKVKKAENMLRKLQENREPSELPTDLEILSAEERFLFRKMGLSMKPFLLLGRRDVFDGTIENIHLHWKYRELVKIIAERRNAAQIKHIAITLEAESGGLLVSIDKTTQGYAIILYRGKNYQRPNEFRPKNLLTKRQALARSIELQRREALKHHITELQDKIQNLKSELEDTEMVEEIDEETLFSRLDASDDEDDMEKQFDAEDHN
ncbi:CRM-domain containing factor CFM3, chloroplastic/mitochondrial [Solanum pennellii]|uniref:CRM-domain containing factor CFM3, chloroplastic/mitochondrial n=1 Tax=Solanum pennellii TaxID=28526 RepID=A0ABM1H8Q6_SOLPN|nr:CRM-domain containing factor CFM3, chloroplastic/mitochondrial [Solanum pennellii]XP_015082039.1 CRM-domain containing factor CFM3, chloroplastic/mitochondrial [Solanum pennellii]XP_015082040.1 CRM-domain containing factor CFM3, chloroplastic/mitochondrial [Solanum pennellii]XP_015082041.1 CRM-domain containing factor CFM3, chloroplastic/mitochondrial [Solanum pennellii]XP_027774142.1 CRM-domain containing factor CFM3, chloroplastic/mitochondrial [Solanum pennellii]